VKEVLQQKKEERERGEFISESVNERRLWYIGGRRTSRGRGADSLKRGGEGERELSKGKARSKELTLSEERIIQRVTIEIK